MIDTHCHLWFKHFNGEVSAVIDRAKKAGVHTLICVGCDETSSRQSVEIAGQFPNVYAAVGVHPTETSSLRSLGPSSSLEWVKKFLNEHNELKSPHEPKRIVAIGETGIDFFHEPYDQELQKTMFREQCLIAREFNLPVIVHLRSGKNAKAAGQGFTAAEKACLEVLDDVVAQAGKGDQPLKVLFHCFSSDRRFAEEVLKRGWFLSFSGVITYPNAHELREVVKMCPLDRMVVETDSPFLAPQPHRGQRNEPAFIVETARQIAELKGISYEEMEKRTDENARAFFSL